MLAMFMQVTDLDRSLWCLYHNFFLFNNGCFNYVLNWSCYFIISLSYLLNLCLWGLSWNKACKMILVAYSEVKFTFVVLFLHMEFLRVIYPISKSMWVSLAHVVSKKIKHYSCKKWENELLPIRMIIEWKMCKYFWKLNPFTIKDHFSLPFIDKMLERLAKLTLEDQEKTILTCPFGTFVLRRMSFNLCNVTVTF